MNCQTFCCTKITTANKQKVESSLESGLFLANHHVPSTQPVSSTKINFEQNPLPESIWSNELFKLIPAPSVKVKNPCTISVMESVLPSAAAPKTNHSVGRNNGPNHSSTHIPWFKNTSICQASHLLNMGCKCCLVFSGHHLNTPAGD